MSAPKNLVIVESPGKVNKIQNFLGSDYKVMSSYGHIRDLKKKVFSIDVEHNFQPIYEIPDDKTQIVSELKKAAAKADMVWLASDEDREGEAIAWHLYEVLGLKPEKTRRIVFHEITKKALLNAIENPRDINIPLVDAQQARRVLDRIVGFELSPVLWKRLMPSLSAGRVQSVTARLIVERENAIREFVSEPYFRATANFTPKAGGHCIKAELNHRISTEEEARNILNDCATADFKVASVEVKPLTKTPAPPFTTSTLQQEASRKLGFSVSQTMSVAQRLYENGNITYMRTDSVNLSEEALSAIKKLVIESSGEEYYKRRQYHTTSRGAQEAHEAIRPTYADVETLDGATAQEQKLYTLIRRRAIASQMADAHIEKTTVDITAGSIPYSFAASDETVVFPGFLRMYTESTDDEQETISQEMSVTPGLELAMSNLEATERFTQQPPRYTEAALVKKMEELGIGRPSTYSTIISTIQHRGYVERGEKEGTPRPYTVLRLKDGKVEAHTETALTGGDKGKLVPTDTGMIVNDFLTEYFPDILDYNFTAHTEEKFDEIANGKLGWEKEISDFYSFFHPSVDKAHTINKGLKFGERILGEDSKGRPVSVKIGRFGPVVQVGSSDSEEKPLFASLLKGQTMSTLTLEEALKLFEFPRALGTFDDADVTVAIGRFGPYVRHAGVCVSIPKEIAPAELSLEEAIELIKNKRESDAKKTIKVFEEDPEMQVLNGRFGPYIAYKKKNYKLPRGLKNPEALTIDEARKIIEEAEAAPAKKRPASNKKK